MILSLDGRRPQVGRAGASLCRLSPHLVCLDFLASLGESREWVVRRHRIDAARAVGLVFERLQPACAGGKGAVLSLPAYLTRAQAVLLGPLANKARLALLGSVSGPLAGALAAHAAEAWSGTAVVIDADDHALTASTVVADDEQLWIHATQSWPHFNLRAWKGRLLDKVSDRCIRQSRRDPRDSAAVEQSLYEQLERALGVGGRTVELLIQTTNWYQNLLIQPEEMLAACDGLVRQARNEIQAMLSASPARDSLRTVLVTAAAGRLPGFVDAMQELVREVVPPRALDASDDFGEDLMPNGHGPVRVTVLAADAAARAAHSVAARMHRGELPRGHLDLALPLPRAESQAAPGKRTFRLFSADPEP
jgi:hypothetical protein